MDYLLILVGFIVICFFVIIVAGFFETKVKKTKEPVKETPAPDASEKAPEFVEGRLYQMEDGSFAKYVGNGKFLKVKK